MGHLAPAASAPTGQEATIRRHAITRWAGHEFVALSAEAPPDGPPGSQLDALVTQFADTLRAHGTSLDHTLRTRLWAIDSASRNEASAARVQALAGPARSASSSYIAPGRFLTTAAVGLDLLALRPVDGQTRKTVVEYDPPVVPIRYLTCGRLVVLSGLTAVLATLAEQVSDIADRATTALDETGAASGEVEELRCYLRRDQEAAELGQLLTAYLPRGRRTIVEAVDGYSADGKLVEIEITALRDSQPT